MAAGLILEMSICVGVMRPGMHFLSVPWTILKCAKLKKKKKNFLRIMVVYEDSYKGGLSK